MARTLTVTLNVTIGHLDEDEVEAACQGADYDDDEKPTGTDADLDGGYPSEYADLIRYTIEANNDEMWAGSNLFAKITDVDVVTAFWAEQDPA